MGYRIRPLAAAMAVAFSSSAFAQPANSPKYAVLNEVVVTANKIREAA